MGLRPSTLGFCVFIKSRRFPFRSNTFGQSLGLVGNVGFDEDDVRATIPAKIATTRTASNVYPT